MNDSRTWIISLLLVGLSAPAVRADLYTYTVHVYFSDANEANPFTFRLEPNGVDLQANAIPLAINDVVQVTVRPTGSGRFRLAEWTCTEVWSETRKENKKTVTETRRNPHFQETTGMLGAQIRLQTLFGHDATQVLPLNDNPASNRRLVERAGSLTFSGNITREEPQFTKTRTDSIWEGPPVRIPSSARHNQLWYTLIVTVRR